MVTNTVAAGSLALPETFLEWTTSCSKKGLQVWESQSISFGFLVSAGSCSCSA